MLVTVIRTLILYTTVIIALRIMGKRQLGELQPSELVVAIMISDLACVPMQSISIPLVAGIIPVFTLIVAEVIVSFISMQSKVLRRFISGEPSVVIYDGKIRVDELKKLRFNINDLTEELRLAGYHNICDVDTAIVETSGKLSIIPKDSSRTVTVSDMKIKSPAPDGLPCMVITDGSFNRAELKRLGKNEAEIKKLLHKKGFDNLKNILLASVDRSGQIYVQLKEDKKQ